MTLAVALLAALLTAALAALAARRTGPRAAWRWSLLAALVPLAGAWLVAGRAPRDDAAFRAQLVGQYAPLLDTLRLGGARAADVRLPTPDERPVALRAAYDLRAGTMAVRVDTSAAPVLANGVPVNALPLGRTSEIRVGGARPVTITSRTPRWPLTCLLGMDRACRLREWHVRAESGARERTLAVAIGARGTSAGALGEPLLARAPLTLFFHDGDAWLAASPHARVTVDGVAIPATAQAPAPVALQVGLGASAAALRLEADRTDNRLRVVFGRRLAPAPWPLVARAGERATWRVTGASDGEERQPGTLARLALGLEAPLGAARRDAYDGALAWTGRAWEWHAGGRARPVAPRVDQLLPGTGRAAVEHGHLLRVSPADAAADPLPLLTAFWLLGALLLAADAARGDRDARALRVAVVGVTYALLCARVVLAVRVTRAAPFSEEAVPTTIVLLAAFPLLAWLLARWTTLPGFGPRLAPAWSALRDGVRAGGAAARVQLRAWRVPAGAALLVAGTAVAVWAAAGGADRAAFTLLVPLVGSVGLAALHRVLVPALAQDAARGAPLGFLAPHSDFGFGRRHLARSVLALLVLVALYVALVLSPRGVSTLLSLVAYAGAVAWVHLFVRERAELRPRLAPARAVRLVGAVAGAGALAGLTVALLRSTTSVGALVGAALLGGALAGGAAVAALLPRVRALRAWPYRARDVLPPMGFVLLPAALLLVSSAVSVSRLGITLGFAIACAGLLLVVRVVTVLWYAETRARALASPSPRTLGWWIVLAALSVYAGYLAADRGLVLLLFTAVLTTVVFGAATLGGRRLAGALAMLTGVLMAIGFALHAPLRTLPHPDTELATPQMRYAAVQAPAALQAQALVASPAQAREIVSTLQQDWGMRAYSALGRTWGRGLYGVPYVPRAIAPDVALTDNVFALWILAEHGFAGAAALLLTYLALAGVLLLGAAHATRRYSTVHRAILLGGLAAYVLMPALYMAAANASLLPLTGQNLPGLGLRSGADAAFVAWLVALALAALPGEADDAPRDYIETRANEGALRRVRRALSASAAVAVSLTLVVGIAAWRATHQTPGPFALDAMGDALRAVVARGDVRVEGDTLAVAPTALGKPGFTEGAFLRELVASGNAFAAGRGERRAHCLDRAPWLSRADAQTVRVSDQGCRVASPLPGETWRGALASADGTERLLVGGRLVVRFDPDAPATVATCADTGVLAARAVSVQCGDGARLHARLSDARRGVVLARTEGAVRIARAAAAPDTASGERALAAGDVVVFDGAGTFVADEAPRGAYGYARWRNGDVSRVTPAGTAPFLASLDSTLARAMRAPGADDADAAIAPTAARVALTLDAALMRDLQARVAERCASAAGGRLRQCAVTLVDPTTGDVLALASWERPGYRPRGYQPLDANFRAARGASTVKPLLAAAVFARYPKLRTLAVEHPGETFTAAAGWPVATGTPFASALHGCRAPIDWSCALPGSNNLYAVTLGLLGLAAEQDASAPLPRLDGRAPVGAPFRIEGRPVRARPRLDTRDGGAARAASPLARNMELLFDARTVARPTAAFDTTLWAGLRAQGVLGPLGPSWQRVSPELVQLPLASARYDTLRYLVGFLTGEGEHLWSNAALARAMARLTTGDATELRLVRGVGDAPLRAPSARALPFGSGRAAVLEGMRGVVRDGTGARARQALPSPALDLFGKTGTAEMDVASGATPISRFVFGGRARDASAPRRPCPVVGAILVEGEPGATGRLPAVDLFADAVAPVLRERKGWAGEGLRAADCGS